MMKKCMYVISFLLLVCLIAPQGIKAQDQEMDGSSIQMVWPGTDGAVVLLFGVLTQDGQRPIDPQNRIVIRRQEANKKMRKIAEVRFPKSAKELRERLGKMTDELAAYANSASDQQLYEFLTTQPIDSIGVFFVNFEVARALGFAYLDTDFQAGTPTMYQLERFDQQGNKQQEQAVETDGDLPQYQAKLQVQQSYVTDSLAIISWNAVGVEDYLFPFVYANVYKQEEDGFKLLSKRLPATVADTLHVSVTDPLEPGNTYAYYVQLEDWAGNTGVPSDTLYALSYDPNKLKTIMELKGEQKETGIHLQWKPLPTASIYTGIEVQKSRRYDSAYVVLDTIAASMDTYLDNRVLKGSAYYYRLRPLYLKEADTSAFSYAETSVTMEYTARNLPPRKPQGLSAATAERGVALNWWTSDDIDIYAYRVLRGVSAANMDVLSANVTSTSFVDTLVSPGYSGSFVYAIQAMDHNQTLSDTSDLVAVHIRQAAYVTPPAGLSVRKIVEGVALKWNDVKDIDDNVMGYVVFRKPVGADGEFIVIHEDAVSLPYYMDSTYQDHQAYEYAVASIDVWGNFSNLSPATTVDLPGEYTLRPPLNVRLRNLGSGLEVSWPVSLTDKKGVYAIYRKEADKSAFVRIAETAMNDVFIDKDVRKGVVYEYQVAHEFNGKESDPSLSTEIRR